MTVSETEPTRLFEPDPVDIETTLTQSSTHVRKLLEQMTEVSMFALEAGACRATLEAFERDIVVCQGLLSAMDNLLERHRRNRGFR